MKLDCTEAAKLCTKAEYKEAGFIEKLRLNLHLYFCRTCDKYSENNKKLSSLLQKAEITPCTRREKDSFKEKLKNNPSKSS